MENLTNEICNKNDILSGELADIFNSAGRLLHFEKGQLLFSQDSPVFDLFWVQSGLVKLHKTEVKQRCSILKIEKDNDFVGLSDSFSGPSHCYSATAIISSRIVMIDFSAFNNLLNNNPEFSKIIISGIARESLYFLERLNDRHHKQLPGRVADTLLYFRELFNCDDIFELPLSRLELAQFTGTTKESFIRTLTEFKNDKIINLNDRKVQINSLEILKTLSRLG